MFSCTDGDSHTAHECLGVWEEKWHVRAQRARKAERYRTWWRQQGASRDEAAARAVRFLAEGRVCAAHIC